MKQNICQNCGKFNYLQATYCFSCGAVLLESPFESGDVIARRNENFLE